MLWHGKMRLERCKQTKIHLQSVGKQGKGSSRDCWSVKARSAHWGHQACAAPVLQATGPKHPGLLYFLRLAHDAQPLSCDRCRGLQRGVD